MIFNRLLSFIILVLMVSGCSNSPTTRSQYSDWRQPILPKITKDNIYCQVVVPNSEITLRYYLKNPVDIGSSIYNSRAAAYWNCDTSEKSLIDRCELDLKKPCSRVLYQYGDKPVQVAIQNVQSVIDHHARELTLAVQKLQNDRYIGNKIQSINRENMASGSTDLTKLTNAVMNGWRADYKQQMGALINSSDCSQSVNLDNLTNSVMNGWRAHYKQQMGALMSCSGCSQSVNLDNLTNSVMNGWRADYKQQMGALLSCI